jgi:L-iditol 2-dehydrogenase
MQALVFSHGKLALRRIEKPVPKKTEAIIRVRKAGICGTDISIASGDYKIIAPVVLGHEVFGEVDESSGTSKIPSGSRVVSEINVSCGVCNLCKSGLRNHCSKICTIGITRNGGFADYLSTPIENLHLIPDSISDEEAVFVEPLAAAIQLTKMASIRKGSTCAVVGVGRLGLLILQVLKIQEPKLLVAVTNHTRNRKRCNLARSLGAHEVLSLEGARESVERFTKGIGFDNVVEATGNPRALDFALELVRPRGTIHVKSTHGVPVNFDLTKAVVKEVKIQGSRCGPFEEAITLLKERRVSTEGLITDRFGLEEFRKAFMKAKSPESIKVIFVI